MDYFQGYTPKGTRLKRFVRSFYQIQSVSRVPWSISLETPNNYRFPANLRPLKKKNWQIFRGSSPFICLEAFFLHLNPIISQKCNFYTTKLNSECLGRLYLCETVINRYFFSVLWQMNYLSVNYSFNFSILLYFFSKNI